uniref:Putative ovule protein n=1 Tax=Solanum chacoense TaxID=4108 RepID=A0A0V0INX3_SOLCH
MKTGGEVAPSPLCLSPSSASLLPLSPSACVPHLPAASSQARTPASSSSSRREISSHRRCSLLLPFAIFSLAGTASEGSSRVSQQMPAAPTCEATGQQQGPPETTSSSSSDQRATARTG